MSLRLFSALAVPGDVAERLAGLMRGVGGARWRPRESLHVTLCFYGDVQEPAARDLDAALDSVALAAAPFDITLKGAGAFGGADPHSLWIGVAANPALEALAKDCARAARHAGVRVEPRKYTPHVTLAYLRGTPLSDIAAFEQRHALFTSRTWRVDRFGLFSSRLRQGQPSAYLEEASYTLGG